MLRHQEIITPNASATVRAAEERVTAQELADALGAIERRRAERARQIEGTIPIGEALQQLGLEAAPDEILEEVRAQRARLAAARETRNTPKLQPRRWLWLAPVTVFFLVFGLYGLRTSAPPPMTAATIAASPASGGQSAIRVVDGTGGREVIRTLAEIGDNRPVRCGWADAVRLLQGGEAGYITGQEQSEARSWRIVKHGGKIYLRGWLALPTSEAALRAGVVTLYSARPNSEGATQITLPAGTSRYYGGMTGAEPERIEIGVSSLDEHAWEKW